jgi:ABC-type uncharacterized transport system fused permease/ATPase subunit
LAPWKRQIAPPRVITNIDQRITTDVDTFCDNSVKILEKLIITPFVILFYTLYLSIFFDFFSPVLCFVYFLVGGFICHSFARRIISIGYIQSQFEGDFRLLHISFLESLESVILLFGGRSEEKQLAKQFQSLLQNKASLIWGEYILNFFTNWFDYAGTTGTSLPSPPPPLR